MALTIITNIPSMTAQRSLANATNALNTSIERMTTGYKINSAKDNAAGYSIATTWSAQLSSLDVASDNAAVGADLLTTTEDSYSLLTEHLQRIRDLTEQAANGTYGSSSLKAIQAEVYARLQEIDRVAASTEFNGIKLMSYSIAENADNSKVGIRSTGLALQVGINSDSNSVITLDTKLFHDASICGLFNQGIKGADNTALTALYVAAGGANSTETGLSGNLKDLGSTDSDVKAKAEKVFAAACSNLVYDAKNDKYTVQTAATSGANQMLTYIDKVLSNISSRVTEIGANSNRVSSATSSIDVQIENLTSSLSTLRDTDIASESSEYVKQQILQQSSSTLLAAANQMPSIALQLI